MPWCVIDDESLCQTPDQLDGLPFGHVSFLGSLHTSARGVFPEVFTNSIMVEFSPSSNRFRLWSKERPRNCILQKHEAKSTRELQTSG